MKSSLIIHIIGVHHSDEGICKRIEEIGNREKPDAIFIEAPSQKLIDTNKKKLLRLFLRNPVLFILYLTLVEITYRIGLMKRIDIRYSERVANKYNIKIHRIDDQPDELLTDDYLIFPILSWIILIAFVVILLFFRYWMNLILWMVLAVNYSVMNLFATVPKRNEKMKKRLLNISNKENYYNVMLITGKGHVGHFKKILSTDDIDIKTY